MKKVFLFDLDGVIFDTETQYSALWKQLGAKYLPEIEGLGSKIKGQTLTQIFDSYFPGATEVQASIVEAINDFEQSMSYGYIKGVVPFVTKLREQGLKTAVVTSSNAMKMEQVYAHHPEFKGYFDRIFTSEDFTESKPHPQCYLLGAEFFGCSPQECVGFEDSINGLKSVRAAGMTVVGLATTNPVDVIAPMSDIVIPHFEGLEPDDLLKLVFVDK